MFTSIQKTHSNIFYKAFSICLAFLFIFSAVLTPVGFAQSTGAPTLLNLPAPGIMVPVSTAFTPVMIKGINLYPDNPIKFDFIIDSGDATLKGAAFDEEATKLVKYFLASLTVPEDQMWVNLSPYEKDRIIPESFGRTEMGRDLLAQDYLLKQLSASMMYPDGEQGKKFWDRVYKKAYEQFGTTEIPMNTFNKIWIVPKEARVYEHEHGAFVVSSYLNVMLEEDYVALEHHSLLDSKATSRATRKNSTELGGITTGNNEARSGIQSDIIREVLIPEIEREVNEGETFANLRQIYNSMILAVWYKQTLKRSFLGQIYVDQGKTRGVHVDDPQVNQKIYEQYLVAFKKGVYNYIKEDFDPRTQAMIPRKYFSGGAEPITQDKVSIEHDDTFSSPVQYTKGQLNRTTFELNVLTPDGEVSFSSPIEVSPYWPEAFKLKGNKIPLSDVSLELREVGGDPDISKILEYQLIVGIGKESSKNSESIILTVPIVVPIAGKNVEKMKQNILGEFKVILEGFKSIDVDILDSSALSDEKKRILDQVKDEIGQSYLYTEALTEQFDFIRSSLKEDMAKLVSEVQPISNRFSRFFDSQAAGYEVRLRRYIERPFRGAVRILQKKGIRTIETSANQSNFEKEGRPENKNRPFSRRDDIQRALENAVSRTGGNFEHEFYAHLVLKDSLSSENRSVINDLTTSKQAIVSFGEENIYLFFLITEDTTVEDFSQRVTAVTELFKEQSEGVVFSSPVENRRTSQRLRDESAFQSSPVTFSTLEKTELEYSTTAIKEYVEDIAHEHPSWSNTKGRIKNLKNYLPDNFDKAFVDLGLRHFIQYANWVEVPLYNERGERYTAKFLNFRVQNLIGSGVKKGGDRKELVRQLMDALSEDGKKLIQHLIMLNAMGATVKDVENFLVKWGLDEKTFLAAVMYLKINGLDLVLRGAKGGIMLVEVLGSPGNVQLKDMAHLTYENMARIWDARGWDLAAHGVIGFDRDIPAGDIGISGLDIALQLNGYLRYMHFEKDDMRESYPDLAERLDAADKFWEDVESRKDVDPQEIVKRLGVSQKLVDRVKNEVLEGDNRLNPARIPHLMVMVDYQNKKQEIKRKEKEREKGAENVNPKDWAVPMPWLATYSGKPPALGGLEGRAAATGIGLVYSVIANRVRRGLGESLEGVTFSVEGWGQVAKYAIIEILKRGGKIRIFSSREMAIENPKYWDKNDVELFEGIIDMYGDKYSLVDAWENQALSWAEGVTAIVNDDEDEDRGGRNVRAAKVQWFIPAATQGTLDINTIEEVEATEGIAEGANGAFTPDAETRLLSKKPGFIIIPDMEANSLGVGFSSWEADGNKTGYFEPLEYYVQKSKDLMWKGEEHTSLKQEELSRQGMDITRRQAYSLVSENIRVRSSLYKFMKIGFLLGEEYRDDKAKRWDLEEMLRVLGYTKDKDEDDENKKSQWDELLKNFEQYIRDKGSYKAIDDAGQNIDENLSAMLNKVWDETYQKKLSEINERINQESKSEIVQKLEQKFKSVYELNPYLTLKKMDRLAQMESQATFVVKVGRIIRNGYSTSQERSIDLPRKILILGYSESDSKATVDYLRKSGYEVVMGRGVMDARALLEKGQQFDALLMPQNKLLKSRKSILEMIEEAPQMSLYIRHSEKSESITFREGVKVNFVGNSQKALKMAFPVLESATDNAAQSSPVEPNLFEITENVIDELKRDGYKFVDSGTALIDVVGRDEEKVFYFLIDRGGKTFAVILDGNWIVVYKARESHGKPGNILLESGRSWNLVGAPGTLDLDYDILQTSIFDSGLIKGKIMTAIVENTFDGSEVVVSSPVVKGVEEAPGGIDLNPNEMDLRIERTEGGVIVPTLPGSLRGLENMTIEGFIPVMIQVAPVMNLPMLLGLSDEPEEDSDTARRISDISRNKYFEEALASES